MLLAASTNNSSDLESSPLKPRQKKQVETPREIRHFAVTYDEWQKFYDHETAHVVDNWTNQLATYITRAGITCNLAFKKHHDKKKGSRKKNSNVFGCSGRCTLRECRVRLSVIVEREPKNKGSPSIFTVYMFGEVNHNREIDTASRRLNGPERVVMGMFFRILKTLYQLVLFVAQRVNELGPLAVYEQNMRLADENLLREGNFSQVPSADVLKTVGQEYNNRYRLDEDIFKEVRIFRYITERLDQSSEDVQGKYRTEDDNNMLLHL